MVQFIESNPAYWQHYARHAVYFLLIVDFLNGARSVTVVGLN